MPLLPTTLQTELRKFTDPDYSGFVEFPLDEQSTAEKWAAALKVYFGELTLPTLLPGTLDLAETAMVGAMTPLIAPIPGVGATALGAGFMAFTATFTAGAAPPQIVTPPPALFVPPPLPPTDNGAVAALALASAVQLWAITGMVTIPPASPVPWA